MYFQIFLSFLLFSVYGVLSQTTDGRFYSAFILINWLFPSVCQTLYFHSHATLCDRKLHSKLTHIQINIILKKKNPNNMKEKKQKHFDQ